jgi:sortase A
VGRHEGNFDYGRIYGDLAGTGVFPAVRRDSGKNVVRNIGELLVTAGMVVLLFVIYEVYVTDLISAGKQREATAALDDQWNQSDTVDSGERAVRYDLKDGQGFAKLYIPAFGPDYQFTILEGSTDKILEAGPGHYKGTALPGEPGNFSVAGHRVGKGAPFNDLDLLNSCDAIVVETKSDWFIYRVLPMKDEVSRWAATKGDDEKCANVKPLGNAKADDGGPYGETFGREIVSPREGSVIAAVPHRPDAEIPPAEQASLMTLTTCHPRFSDKQRMIIHSVLVQQWKKDPQRPGDVPPELKET